ncbi:hypothetical protein GQ600_2128 [Phytophthora cactorum]|nr:hypothetical protein GQ600_2128 [Phytophthora cactorum]
MQRQRGGDHVEHQLPLAVARKVSKLQLEDPASYLSSPHQEEEDYLKKTTKSSNPTLWRASDSSITLDHESSVECTLVSSKAHEKNIEGVCMGKRLETDKRRSAFSGRDESNNSHQYYVGIKEKLATITIELNSELAKRCDELVAEVQKANTINAREAERFKMKLKDAKERWAVQEKVRRDQWIVKKTEEIKKSTVALWSPTSSSFSPKARQIWKSTRGCQEERRKLQVQLEKERDVALQPVEAREKERAKLMTRLDAADAELQQQLSTQRRRLQEEAETTRNELYAEMRAAKLAHAKEMDELKELHMQKQQAAAEKSQKEKQDLMTKYESEFMALREQTSVECEQFKAQLTSKLRDEMSKEKQELEKQMLQSRDAKIELVIEKLQEESRQMVERAERKAQKRFSQDRAEYERKLKQTGEIEGVWMEKNRELHEKLSKLERQHNELRRENEALGQDLRQQAIKQATWLILEKRCSSLQTDSEYAQQQQGKQATMESHFQQQVQKLRDEHDTALANLHERVKATVARKDQAIADLQEELHLLQVKLDKSHALIEEQRLQLFSQ